MGIAYNAKIGGKVRGCAAWELRGPPQGCQPVPARQAQQLRLCWPLPPVSDSSGLKPGALFATARQPAPHDRGLEAEPLLPVLPEKPSGRHLFLFSGPASLTHHCQPDCPSGKAALVPFCSQPRGVSLSLPQCKSLLQSAGPLLQPLLLSFSQGTFVVVSPSPMWSSQFRPGLAAFPPITPKPLPASPFGSVPTLAPNPPACLPQWVGDRVLT